MLHQLSHSGRDSIDSSRFDVQIRRHQWHGFLELEHWTFDAARHRDRNGYL
jgi:hypothetical protein